MTNAHLISEPVMFLQNPIISDVITKVVMVNDFLPFMVLISADGIRRTEMFFRMAARKFARKK